MEWGHVLAIIGSNVAIFGVLTSLIVWMRGESRADFRALDTKIDANRAETNARIDALKSETHALINGIQAEMKDFHGRLCAIEERRNTGK